MESQLREQENERGSSVSATEYGQNTQLDTLVNRDATDEEGAKFINDMLNAKSYEQPKRANSIKSNGKKEKSKLFARRKTSTETLSPNFKNMELKKDNFMIKPKPVIVKRPTPEPFNDSSSKGQTPAFVRNNVSEDIMVPSS